MNLLNIVYAELTKLRTLPLVSLTASGAVLLGAVIAIALSTASIEHNAPLTAVEATLQTVPFAQVGIILLGILPAVHEHTGGQYRTSLTAIPNRSLFVTGKSIAAIIVIAATCILTIGASLIGVMVSQQLINAPTADIDSLVRKQLWTAAGGTIYLALIGVFCYAVALFLRQLVPTLVTLLALLLIVPPLATSMTEHARWLPSRAGEILYLADSDTVLTPAIGALVLIGWIISVGAVAVASIHRRDA